jgi:hypothetical protein
MSWEEKQLQYLIKWKGYSESDNTWEPVTHLQTLHLLKEYYKRALLKSIKAGRIDEDRQQPTWPPLPIALTPTMTSIPPLLTGSYHRPPGTSTSQQRSPTCTKEAEAPKEKEAPTGQTQTPAHRLLPRPLVPQP